MKYLYGILVDHVHFLRFWFILLILFLTVIVLCKVLAQLKASVLMTNCFFRILLGFALALWVMKSSVGNFVPKLCILKKKKSYQVHLHFFCHQCFISRFVIFLMLAIP